MSGGRGGHEGGHLRPGHPVWPGRLTARATVRNRRDEWIVPGCSTGSSTSRWSATTGSSETGPGRRLRRRVHHQGAQRRRVSQPLTGRPPQTGHEAVRAGRRSRYRAGRMLAGANRNDSQLLGTILERLQVLGSLPEEITVHLDTGYGLGKDPALLDERGLRGATSHKGEKAPVGHTAVARRSTRHSSGPKATRARTSSTGTAPCCCPCWCLTGRTAWAWKRAPVNRMRGSRRPGAGPGRGCTRRRCRAGRRAAAHRGVPHGAALLAGARRTRPRPVRSDGGPWRWKPDRVGGRSPARAVDRSPVDPLDPRAAGRPRPSRPRGTQRSHACPWGTGGG